MAVLSVPDRKVKATDPREIAKRLAEIGIGYECWENLGAFGPDTTDEEVLEYYSSKIDTLKKQGGYAAADVINIIPTTPGLDSMLDKFNKEHWHDEDEVRFIVSGRGIFHIAPKNADVVAVELEAGDLIRIPRGTRHWFDLCGDRTIRAIRLFQDASGWAPQYTSSGRDVNYQPLCFGATYVPPRN